MFHHGSDIKNVILPDQALAYWHNLCHKITNKFYTFAAVFSSKYNSSYYEIGFCNGQ